MTTRLTFDQNTTEIGNFLSMTKVAMSYMATIWRTGVFTLRNSTVSSAKEEECQNEYYNLGCLALLVCVFSTVKIAGNFGIQEGPPI